MDKKKYSHCVTYFVLQINEKDDEAGCWMPSTSTYLSTGSSLIYGTLGWRYGNKKIALQNLASAKERYPNKQFRLIKLRTMTQELDIIY